MQCANDSSSCERARCCCAWAPGLTEAGPGRIPRHAVCAAWIWGEAFGLPLAIMEICVLPPEIDTCGSGKFATPWPRMHAASLYACVTGLSVDCAPAELVLVVVADEEPPHPAAASATPAAKA